MSQAIPRRVALIAGLAALLGLGVGISGVIPESEAAPAVEVWKSPSCGCCEGWVRHMRAAGHAVTVHDVEDMEAVKAAKGVPGALQSCHTSIVDGYVVEGHVPAEDILRLLAERPAAKGLAAPGMPMSSPGMDIPGHPYEVILFGAEGGDRVYARH